MRIDKFLTTDSPYLTDGGLETFMVFDKGFELPCFSSHVLLETETGRAELRAYFERFLALAAQSQRGFVLDTATWRSNSGWGPQLGLSESELRHANAAAVAFAKDIRSNHESKGLSIPINGIVGPAGDGYKPDAMLSAGAALRIHTPQVRTFAQAGVDMVSAMTMTHAGEAAGIAAAAREIDMPVSISFTVETDGRLPSGQTLGAAIAEVDGETNAYPIYYMINCAHPDHFRDAVTGGEDWTKRVGGIRANASRMSHAELDAAEALDPGNPVELGELYSELMRLLPNIRVVGGCCGTDHRHVDCISLRTGHKQAA